MPPDTPAASAAPVGRQSVTPGTAMSLREPLLDAQQAAVLLNVKVSWIREATRTGQLPCLRVGRHLRYTRPMLEEWLEGHRAGRPQAWGRSSR